MASKFCKIMGVVFLVVAAWGFIDGEKVLAFHVNTAHNVVHLLTGVGALLIAFTNERWVRSFCLAFGAVYLLVGALGFAGVEQAVSLLHLNEADNWLHAALGVLFLGVGLASMRGAMPSRSQTPQTA